MNPPSALSVSAVVSLLREVLESNEFFSDLWIQGEVSNYSRSQVGHRYFSLKDPQAALRTVLFRDNMPGFQLKDGERVIAHGRITVYPQRGELQFVADFVRPEGVGILAAKFEELRLRLEAEGLFDPARKRALPRFPRTHRARDLADRRGPPGHPQRPLAALAARDDPALARARPGRPGCRAGHRCASPACEGTCAGPRHRRPRGGKRRRPLSLQR